MDRTVRIGVDVGGTFTDIVLIDEARALSRSGKLPTTPEDPGRAVIDGVRLVLSDADTSMGQVREIVHGTTLITNTVLERTGAKVGLITTAGFRDILEMGREIRHDVADLFARAAPVLVPRRLRLGVPERMSATGAEIEPLAEQDVLHAARIMLDAGVEALAVGFLHSHANPAHELRARELIRRLAPDLPVTLSAQTAPEIGEYERFTTACVNAYVQPVVGTYLDRLEADLRDEGFTGRLSIMLSSGGRTTVAQAKALPVLLLESGPAAGAIAAAAVATRAGESRVIAFDMGGTTAKLSLVEDGRPTLRHDFEAARQDTAKPGSGLPLKLTVVDMIEIGAGGGSLAWVDDAGLLKVGPRGAGSVPGPVAYGRGGTLPTVTDADLLAGRLDPDRPLGGGIRLALGAAREAVAEAGSRIGLSATAVADGIEELVTESMAAAARTHLAERGRDPHAYTLLSFGGAGPVHAYELAKRLGVPRIVVPPGAGVMSAFGFLAAEPAFDTVRSYAAALSEVDWRRVAVLYEEMADQARAVFSEPSPSAEVVWAHAADLRYLGQGFQITVPLPERMLSAADEKTIRDRFDEMYRDRYGRVLPEGTLEVISWRLEARRPAPPPQWRLTPRTVADPGRRRLRFAGLGDVEADVHDRSALPVGTVLRGPAVIEEPDTSCPVGPDCTVRVDADLNLVIDLDTGHMEGGVS